MLPWLGPAFAHPPETATRARRSLEQGRSAYRQGRLKEAAEYYSAALSRFLAVGDKVNQGICLTNLGLVHLDMGNYAAAQSYSERAIALRSALGERRGVARSLNNLGLALSAQGRYREALATLQKALDLNQQDGDTESVAVNHRNIGAIHFYGGQYSDALTHYHKALAIIEAHASAPWRPAERWATLDGLGAVYKKLGWNEKALPIYLDLLKTPAEDPKLRIYAWNNVGTIYRSLGDPIKARAYYEQALQEAVRLENGPAQLVVLKNLGLIHFLDLRDDQAAIKYLTASLTLSKSLSDPYEEANTYHYLGEIARRQGQNASAQAAFKQSLAIADALSLPDARWASLYGLGQVCEAEGDLPGAQKYYEAAVAVIESARTALRGASLRTGFLADKTAVYEAALRMLLAEKDAASDPHRVLRAFAYSERSKARVMLDLLSAMSAQIEEGIPADLRLRRQQLQRELVAEAGSPRQPSIARELEALELRIQETSPPVHEPKIRTLAEVQRQLLGLEDALVVFFTGRQSIFVWLITRTRARIWRMADPSALEARVRAYIHQLMNPGDKNYLALSVELYDALLRPLLSTLPSTITRLIFVPDGFLYTLPFETLRMRRDPGEGRPQPFLIERYEISYAPSASILWVLRQLSWRDRRVEKSFLGLSVTEPEPVWERPAPNDSRPHSARRSDFSELDKLVYADQELLKIQNFIPGVKEIYRQGRSTKAALRARVATTRFKILHFATHSLINQEVPESSFMLLSPDPAQNEAARLWLYEISNLRLDAEMAVLSSCRSGLGKGIAGEGIIGFTRAFMYAGARSVLTTLWEINDEATPFFMEQFYYHIGRGARAGEALRKAKLKFLSSSRYAHPFYWGAFVITGETSVSIYPVRRGPRWALITLGAALVLLWLIGNRFLSDLAMPHSSKQPKR